MSQEPSGVDTTLQGARDLVLRYGWNSTAYQIINPGIAHWFAARGDALVGYVRHGGARVVAGAPVCALERLPAVVTEFEVDAARFGDRVCYFGAEERLEAVARQLGRHVLISLGAQPVWTPARLVEVIHHHASLRAQLHRATNKGVVVTRWPAEQAAGNGDLKGVLAEWLATRGLPPLRFLVEPQTLSRLEDRRVFVAERNGVVVAFLVASPVPARRGWLIEQIIRGPGAPNGTAELMIHAAARDMTALGSDYVTLGLAPLSRRAGCAGAGGSWWLRAALAWLRAHGRRFYDFDGLDAFKAKFQPEQWTPVFAVTNQSRFSPRMLYAIAAAFSGGSPVWTIAKALGRGLRQELRWVSGGVPLRSSASRAGR
jgi:phosphatidylglycerol lysyltransferase